MEILDKSEPKKFLEDLEGKPPEQKETNIDNMLKGLLSTPPPNKDKK